MKPAGANYGPNKGFIGKATTPVRQAGGTKTAGQVERADGDGAAGKIEQTGGDGAAGKIGQSGDEKKYLAAKVMSASPIELILMMYDQFFSLIPNIKSNMEKRSVKDVEPDAERAQAIIEELINALDFDVEISKDLGAIYFYVRDRIMEGNIKLDPAIWDHIETTLRPLYEGFKNAAGQLETPREDPLKSKSTQVVAGITYDRKSLNEVVMNTRSGLKV